LRLGNAPLLPGLLQIDDVDIIHLHYPFIFGAEIIWAISKLHHIPFVVTYHNDLIGLGLRRLLFNAYSVLTAGRVMNAAAKLGVLSFDHARSCKMTPLFQRRWNDVVEIPNGVDTELFRPQPEDPAVRRDLDIPQDAPLVLFVGALDRAHYYKRIPFLLQVFSKIRRNAVLMIIGDGDCKAQYKMQAETLGIGHRVIFLGRIPFTSLTKYYNCADILVLPSNLVESFGVVLIEAMACEKPVIASDLPGIRAVVSDGVDGWLVPPVKEDAWIEKIQSLLDDPRMRRKMGIRGRAKIEARYAWPKIALQLVRIYEEVLDMRAVTETPENG
jgi:glycosyltransferase involved in cell wall biosynthesis